MKKLLFIVFLLFSTLMVTAQDRSEHRERIKALKTAHITEGLNLTPEEAQKFWPVYNEFEERRRSLYRQERACVGDVAEMDEEAASQKLQEYVELEKQDYLLKKRYYEDLRKIFSAKRIMKLKQVEDEFNIKMMRQYRARKGGPKN